MKDRKLHRDLLNLAIMLLFCDEIQCIKTSSILEECLNKDLEGCCISFDMFFN